MLLANKGFRSWNTFLVVAKWVSTLLLTVKPLINMIICTHPMNIWTNMFNQLEQLVTFLNITMTLISIHYTDLEPVLGKKKLNLTYLQWMDNLIVQKFMVLKESLILIKDACNVSNWVALHILKKYWSMSTAIVNKLLLENRRNIKSTQF